jgi:hypothetical protein
MSFKQEKKYVLHNSGLYFFTWMLLFVLFYDFNGIDLYDALIQGLTHEVVE